MVEHHTASIVTNYLSTMESDTTSDEEENDEYVASCHRVLKN